MSARGVTDDTLTKNSKVVDELMGILGSSPGTGPARRPVLRRPEGRPPPPMRAPPPRPALRPVPPPAQRPAQLEHAVRERLMTFDELAEKIGHKPKADVSFGLFKKKMSGRYKAVEAATGDVQDQVAATGAKPLTDVIGDKGKRDAIEAQLEAQLDALIARCEAYQSKHKKQPALGAVQAMVDNAKAYKASFKGSLDKVLADPAIAQVAGKMTIDEAIFAKECGISFADCKVALYNDDELAGLPDDSFGSGAVNTVAKLVHKDGTPRIFKPEQSTDGKPPLVTKTIGIDPKEPHYGNRNVASRAASDALGLNVMPPADFALHNGSVGLLMGMAPGKSPRQKIWQDVSAEKSKECDTWEREGGGWLINFKNQSIEKRGGKWQKGTETMVKPWTGAPSPDLQASLHEELNGLEWCDMLTGQGDRHSANYMVDIQGDSAKVTGIDNDFAFGKNQTGLLTYDPGKGITSVGTPKLIDRKSYTKLAAGDFDRDMLPKLKGLLTDEEVAASKQRFNAVKAKAAELNGGGLVVDNWKTWRSPDGKTASQYLDEAGTPSLFKRDFAKFLKADGVL